MKKIIISLLVLSTIFSMVSCMNNNETARDIELSERNIVGNIGFKKMDMASEIADLNNIEAITEMATQIVMVTVNKLEKVIVTQLNLLDFTYDVTIDKIYMDASGKLKEDDKIIITSGEGIIKGTEYTALVKNSAHAQKYGYANREYAENDYITSSVYDAIPIEVGITYIMYLSDDYLENYGVYPEIGRMFLYEYTDGALYSGADYIKMDISIKSLENQISNNIKSRTGRADEIGVDAYIDELGEIQREQNQATQNIEN